MDPARYSREELFVRAREHVCDLLAPPARAMLLRMSPELTTMELALKDVFNMFFAGHKTYVGSAESFVFSTSDVFSITFAQHFLQRADWFDRISGCPNSPTNFFLEAEPLGVHLKRVAEGMATAAESMAAAELDMRPVVHPSSSAAPFARLHHTVPTPTISNLPEQSNEQDSSDNGAQEESSGCPIINIELRGRTICEAWRANSITKGMEDAATAPVRQDPAWTPGHFPLPMAVYHGTVKPQRASSGFTLLANDLAHSDSIPVLRGSVSRNQVAPDHPYLAVLWTSFSPLRAFLWASFVSEVLSDIPNHTVSMALSQSYVCPRQPLHTHNGVRLLEFRPRLTGNDEQRVFVMPRGVEDQWCLLANQSADQAALLTRQTESTAPIWAIFSRLHHEANGQSWPSVIHCHEVTAQARMLRQFTEQLWKSVWYGPGIAELNRHRERVFSISFRRLATPTSSPATPATPSSRETLPKKL